MPQQNLSSSGAAGQNAQAPMQLATFAMRALGQACELNLSASRALLQTQARAASAVGWPDWSPLFDAVDEPTRRIFSVNTDQWVSTAQRASEVASQLQREVGRLVETQATSVAQVVEQGLHQLSNQTGQGFDQLADTVQQQAKAMDDTTSRVGEDLRQSVAAAGRSGGVGSGPNAGASANAGSSAGRPESSSSGKPEARKSE